MINVSSEFKEKMKESRKFLLYAQITFANGDVMTLDSSQFTASNNNIVDGAGISAFPLGVAIQKNIQIEILNDEEQYADVDFFGAKIRLYIDFELSTTTERVEKGTYTVVTPETYGETIIITAYDDMYRADKEYSSNLSFPQSAGTVLRDICSTCDISLGSTSFLHDDFIVQEKPSGKFREVIGYIAMIACGNARIDTKGYLRIMTYDFSGFETEGAYHVLNEWKSPKIEYNDSVITGVKTVIKGDTPEDDEEVCVGTDAYMLSIENPLISGSETTVLTWIMSALGNTSFRPFSGDLISNPLIEFMDLVKVKDRRGNLYNSCVTDVNFLCPGYTTVKNNSPSMERYAMSYPSSSAKAEASARKLFEKEKSDREQAIENLATRLSESSGMYITVDQQPDGSSIYYMHNKPTLEESDIVWKLTAEAFGISTDGGETYPYGFTVTGEMITRVLYAEGINADYIDTGALTVRDADGNVIFQVDMDTKKVIISGDFVSIGGQSATEAINDALDKADKAKSLNIILSNEYQGVPTDEDGNYTTFPDCSTTVALLQGGADVSASAAYSINPSGGVTATWDNSTRICTVTGLTADSGYVEISATYGETTVSKKFTLAKQKQGLPGSSGYVVVLENDSQTIPCNRSAMISEDMVITIPFRGFYGSKQVPCSCTVDEDTLPDDIAVDSITNATETNAGSVVLYAFSGGYLDTLSGTVKLDFAIGTQIVTKYFSWSVALSGANGAAGASARIYIIEPSVYTITRDSSGKLTPANVIFKAKYRTGTSTSTTTYAGRFKIETSTDGTTYTTVHTSTSNTSQVNYGISDQNIVMIRCTLYAAGGTTTVLDTQTVAVLSDGADGRTYFIQASANSVTYNPDTNTSAPANIEFKSWYREGSSAEKVANPVWFYITFIYDGTYGWDLYMGSAAELSHTQAISSVLASTGGQVKCSIYKSNAFTESEKLDEMTIPLILNGKQGEPGKDAAEMTPEEVFNKLTNNGTIQGLFMEDDQIYVNATYIKSGTLSADLIKGGTLKLGRASNTNGKIYVYNASGTLIGRWDSDGIYVNGGSIYCKTATSGASIYGGRMHMTHGDIDVGYIGTNYFTNYSAYKGLVFDLEYDGGAYMTWAAQMEDGGNFLAKLLYAKKTFGSYVANRLYLGCDLDVSNYNLRNVKIQTLSGINGYTPFTGTLPVVTSITARADGGINWTYGNVTIRNGIITAVPS